MSKYSLGQTSKKLTKKHGQQRYCKGLIHCECLGDRITNKKMEFNTVNSAKETCGGGIPKNDRKVDITFHYFGP